MTAARRIQVDDFDHLTAPRVIHRLSRTPPAVNRSRLFGISGTLLLHGVAAALAIPSTLTHKITPLDAAGVAGSPARTAPADELVLINVYSPKKHDEAPVAPRVDLGSQLAKLAIPLVVPDRMQVINLPGDDSAAEGSAQENADPGDAELRARMFGRYTGQINARIERAWERPRSPVTELRAENSANPTDPDTFVCEVQIRQDSKGNVQEVLLLACNGTEAWRHSLVVAINQSSPLPAPPIPTVFTRAITMTFEGHGSRDGSSSDGLEVGEK